MGRLLLIQSLTFITSFCFGQEGHKSLPDSLLISFIDDVTNKSFLKEVTYVDILDTSSLLELKLQIGKQHYFEDVRQGDNSIITKRISLTQDELANITSQLQNQDRSWLTTNFSKVILITKQVAKKIDVQPIYTVTKPIFLRDNSLCLFYIAYYCGPLCGAARLSFYTLQKGKWIEYLNFYLWES